MFRLLIPTILIGISLAGFFVFTKPILGDISDLKKEINSYNEALDNAKALEAERDKLTSKYNSIDPVNLEKLQKMLPDSVDNIRLILEIEKLASPYGMTLKDVKYESQEEKKEGDNTNIEISENIAKKDENKNYGTWELEFSTQGSYANFVSFLKDIEKNLRVVDISSINFSSEKVNVPGKSQSIDSYKYTFKIKTYWLKN